MALNSYIYINSKLFEIVNRKSNDKKISSKSRTINGTLKIDSNQITKKKWVFEFSANERQKDRLYSIWLLNSSLSLIDIDGTNYNTVACTSEEFSPDFTGQDESDYLYTISLEFEQI